MAPATQSIPIGEFTSHNEQETFDLGFEIGKQLSGGEILLLSGPLGAGKTLFVKGIAHALGVDRDDVSSPSFTLVNPYQGRLLLYHIDLYRLDEGASAAHAVDLDELLSDEDAVIVIEWAERMGRYPLPTTAWKISITGDGDAPRRISLKMLESVAVKKG
ncbi:MAG TPA: tRNA (adenosine(37)-N6)-threonylcarbamoyltransferase complex ATPase subunit type 1 TsaE [Pyrinomonadaceae bacterium]|nr:tRNA (adenosine(37)-N6)-threonylcarbamoyltransferase complex ATPase subunit type 1 TsaE [Pyrinomonadaceae bacterium]